MTRENPSFDPSLLAHKNLANPVKIGVLGLGRIGWGHHAEMASFHNGFELTAVCDIEAERVEKAAESFGCRGFTDYRQFLRDGDFELVVVASQSSDHEQHTLMALQADKHVLCEKPACRTLAGLDQMRSAAKSMGKLLTIHHSQRVFPECLAIREVLASGVLGQIFRIQRVHNSFQRRNDWQVLSKYNGGILSNWGTHIVDQLLYLAHSAPRHVWAAMRREFNPGDTEDDIKAVIECENGVVLDLDVTYVDASDRPSWVVQGNRGTCWITGERLHLKYLDGNVAELQVIDDHRAHAQTYGVDGEGDSLQWRTEEREAKPKMDYEGFYDNLYRAVRQDRPLLVSAESARRTYDVLARIRDVSGETSRKRISA